MESVNNPAKLHKGGAGRELFIQFTTDAPEDLPIPEMAVDLSPTVSFATLEASQASGDRGELDALGRRMMRFHLADRVTEGLRRFN